MELPAILKPENYTYIGKYSGTPWGISFWILWYQETLAHKVGISTSFGGWCEFKKEGHTFFHTEEVERIMSQLAEHIEAGDMEFFANFSRRAHEAFAHAIAYADSLPERSDDPLIYLDPIVAEARNILFFWNLGWQISQVIDRSLPAWAKLHGMSVSELQKHIEHIPSLLSAQQDDARRLKALLTAQGFSSMDVLDIITALEDSNDLKNTFEAHVKKYGWILNIDWNGQSLTLRSLLEQLMHIDAFSPDVERGESLFSDRAALFYAGVTNQFGSEYLSQYAHKVKPLLEQIAHIRGITYDDLRYLVPDEVRGNSDTVSLKERVRTRRETGWCVYTKKDNTLAIIDDESLVRDIDRLFARGQSVGESMELIGRTGFPGHAQGRVKVVVSDADFEKFNAGDVLVAPMTTPDFVLLMQKSVAIVTDMGGVLSHAAIVARELKKPCVIGTAHATQILRDGDLVEVDANTGVVRILERKE